MESHIAERYLTSKIFHCQNGRGILFHRDTLTYQEFSQAESCQMVYIFNTHFFSIFLCISCSLGDYTTQERRSYICELVDALEPTTALLEESLVISQSTNYWILLTVIQYDRHGNVTFYLESVYFFLPSLPSWSQATITFPLIYCYAEHLSGFPGSFLILFQSNLYTATKVIILKITGIFTVLRTSSKILIVPTLMLWPPLCCSSHALLSFIWK